ncbi:LOW QUALITY PROTEIN: interleukin-20 receptor subunit beta [Dryobates pubescens]|uniref:LOW QUALITY PROTEIN: interleukin-20 receptor subunit beta n=1 Tax=Dryobates pubescens TaxID=118200 RepID=UPI0023B8DAD0|nr:LOW QUALITY PROTEIN: interleukin-20 receptor subunit beta [Dryobates pubescens]
MGQTGLPVQEGKILSCTAGCEYGRVTSRSRMSLKLICFYLCFLIAPSHTGEDALLPAPQNISILSTNMKHFLTWSPVIVQGETVRYSVEFQGEYEREYANESWIPICECSLIAATECNITEDISATVAYNLRVRANAGARRSEWGTLQGFFNRITTSLTPPLMKVIADGYHLLVQLEDMGPAFQFCVLYWKKGHESRMQQKVVKEVNSVVHLDTMEAGLDYCVKAQAKVEAINRSSSFSQTQCVRAQGGTSMWLVTALISAGFAMAALTLPFLTWKASKILSYSFCPTAVQPDTLKISDPPTQLMLCGSEEAEQRDLMVRVIPSEEVLRLWIQETL